MFCSQESSKWRYSTSGLVDQNLYPVSVYDVMSASLWWNLPINRPHCRVYKADIWALVADTAQMAASDISVLIPVIFPGQIVALPVGRHRVNGAVSLCYWSVRFTWKMLDWHFWPGTSASSFTRQRGSLSGLSLRGSHFTSTWMLYRY